MFNGALGAFHNIIWTEYDDALHDPPFAVLVAFESYTGPSFQDRNGARLVPIFRSRREFFYQNSVCYRSRFLLTLAYAIAVHKSQGITVGRAVLNISGREFSPELSYVAVSRLTAMGLQFLKRELCALHVSRTRTLGVADQSSTPKKGSARQQYTASQELVSGPRINSDTQSYQLLSQWPKHMLV